MTKLQFYHFLFLNIEIVLFLFQHIHDAYKAYNAFFIAFCKTPIIHYNSALHISLGYLAGRLRNVFIHLHVFVSISFFVLVLPKKKREVPVHVVRTLSFLFSFE